MYEEDPFYEIEWTGFAGDRRRSLRLCRSFVPAAQRRAFGLPFPRFLRYDKS